MAITVKHLKVSAIPDDADTSLVRPSDWNADHTLTGTIEITNGGTGQTTANAAFNALAPSQTGNTGKYLTTDGTDTSWSVNPLGTVTSVAATAGTGISITGSPITTSGTLNITNTAPDQVVSLTGAGTTTVTGTYPNFTITSTDSKAGDVVGPSSATDNAIVRFDTTTGKLIQNSVVTMDDTGVIAGATLTSPKINEILDTNGNEILGLSPTASATDFLTVKNGIGVGVPLHFYADGTSTNIGLHIQPKGSGLVTISDGTDFNKGIRFRSSGSSASAITLLDAVATAGRVVTLPNATTTLVGRDTTDTLTNKDISGSTNTLSNIGNSSLTNSAITINGTSTSLGGSINVGTVTSVTGTAPVVSSGGATPAISMAAATGSVDGYLTSTDWTTFNNKGSGTVTSVAALTIGTTGTDLSSTVATGTTTPVITLQVPTASAANRGALSAADWTTFNNKGSGTVTSIAATVPSFLSVAGSPITTSGTLALTYSGTALPVANGGTGITSFGSGIATWLGTPSSANLASAVTDETGSGSLVFATSPTLVTPVLGTPASGNLDSCTADGTNKVGYRNIPNSGAKTSSYTLVAGDVGKFVELGTGGSVVVPASVFAAGDAITIFNNTSASISCTCSAITDFYKGGTDTDISTFSVTTRGVATILFITATRAVVTGNLA